MGSQSDHSSDMMHAGAIAKPILRLLICILAVFVATAVLDAVSLRDRPLFPLLIFLFLVLIVSSFWGFRYALFVSLLAALGFSWLRPPVHHFWLSDSHDIIALAAFLVIGITTSHFSDRARREALSAKRAEDAARRSEEGLREVIETMPAMVWSALPDGSNSFVNRQWAEYTGLSAEQTPGSDWRSTVHPEDLSGSMEKWRHSLATGQPFEHELRLRRTADGQYRWFLFRSVPLREEHGEVLKWYGIATDIEDRKRAEEALLKREHNLNLIINAIPALSWSARLDGSADFFNQHYLDFVGLSAEQAQDWGWTGAVHPEDLNGLAGTWQSIMATGKAGDAEARLRRFDGEYRWFLFRASPLRDESGNIVKWFGINTDITERKRAEEALRQSEERWRSVFENSAIGVALTGLDSHYLDTNHVFQTMLGYNGEELRALTYMDITHENYVEANWTQTTELVEGKRGQYQIEKMYRRKDGVLIWVNNNVSLVPGTERVPKFVMSLSEDITERKRAEDLLTGEKRILEMVAKGDPLPQILDSVCRFVEEQASGLMASILLVDGNRVRFGGAPNLPKAYTDAIDGVAIGPSAGSCGTAAYRGEQVIVEDIATDPLWADYREAALPHSLRACWSTPIFSSQGKVIATFAMYYHEPRSPSRRDQETIEQITHLVGVAIERKLTQEALQRSEAYLAEAQSLTHTGSWVLNLRTGARFWSQETFRIFDYDPEKVTPSWDSAIERVHPEDRAMIERRAQIEYAQNRWENFQTDFRIMLPDGTIKHLHSIARPTMDESGDITEVIGTIMDVTEAKRAEEMLRRSEESLLEAQRLSHMGSWTYDVSSQKVTHSPEGDQIYGVQPNEDNSAPEFFFSRIHPADRERMRELFARCLIEKSDIQSDYAIVLPDGAIKHIHVLGHPILNESGDLVEFVGTIMDVTERRRAEEERERLRQLEAELAHMNRVTMLGELASSLAHELNQPIAAAITSANACLRWLAHNPPDLERARAAATRIENDGSRAAEIIQRLRAFYKTGAPPQRELVDLNQVAREMLALLSNEADRHSIWLRTELALQLPQIMADRVQLQQVLMNLLLNGIEAMTDGAGELTIRSQCTEDGRLLISVSDTGVGLPSEKLERLFSAFYTTKPQGTGMGLAISRSIIEAHGGRLWATANAERGATFHFTLPAELLQ
jgi:PAS domain S-box-containing protein